MKTLFYSLLATAIVLSSIAAKSTSILQLEAVGPKLTFTIELGRKSKNCERIGVCHFTLGDGQRQSGPGGENTVTGTAWVEKGKLQIEFNRASMTDTTYQTHFGSGQFQLEEDYILPSDVANALGVRSYTIKTGKYSVPQSIGEYGIIPVTF